VGSSTHAPARLARIRPLRTDLGLPARLYPHPVLLLLPLGFGQKGREGPAGSTARPADRCHAVLHPLRTERRGPQLLGS